MTVVLKTRTYVPCPRCDVGEFNIQHLLDAKKSFVIGPWVCDNRHCDAAVTLRVSAEGEVDVVEVRESEMPRALVLLRFGDLYLVTRGYTSDGDQWDYLYHSHQCPTNLLRHVYAVFDQTGEDPHGRLRYVAEILDTPDNLARLEKQTHDLKTLFEMFGTGGEPRKGRW